MEENIGQSVSKEVSGGILRYGAAAFFYAFAALAFFAALFVAALPYPAMKFYNGIGMNARALESAKAYTAKNAGKYVSSPPSYDSKYTDALLYCLDTSSAFMNGELKKNGLSGKAVKYAVMTDKYATEFLSYGLDERISLIDTYAFNNTPAGLRPFVYSYKSGVQAAQIRAKVLSGNAADAAEELISWLSLPENTEAVTKGLDGFADIAAYFGAVSGYLDASVIVSDAGKYGDGFGLIVKDSALTDFYNDTQEFFLRAKDYIVAAAKDNSGSSAEFLKKLHCFKLIAGCADSFYSCFLYLSQDRPGMLPAAQEKASFWDSARRMPEQADKTMSEYFMLSLIYEYKQMVL